MRCEEATGVRGRRGEAERDREIGIGSARQRARGASEGRGREEGKEAKARESGDEENGWDRRGKRPRTIQFMVL